MITSSDDGWIRGVAALEPTFVRNDQAALALTWLAASPDDVEVYVEGRHDPSVVVVVVPDDTDFDPWATLVFADGTRLGLESWRGGGGGRSNGRVHRGDIFAPAPAADVSAVELVWQAFDLHATVPLPPKALRDAAARAVPRG